MGIGSPPSTSSAVTSWNVQTLVSVGPYQFATRQDGGRLSQRTRSGPTGISSPAKMIWRRALPWRSAKRLRAAGAQQSRRHGVPDGDTSLDDEAAEAGDAAERRRRARARAGRRPWPPRRSRTRSDRTTETHAGRGHRSPPVPPHRPPTGRTPGHWRWCAPRPSAGLWSPTCTGCTRAPRPVPQPATATGRAAWIRLKLSLTGRRSGDLSGSNQPRPSQCSAGDLSPGPS